MHTEISIDIAASPRTVFELAHDISRWPALLPHYRRVTIQSRNEDRTFAIMRAVRPIWRLGIPVSWRTEQWADETRPDDLRLRFVHLAGPTHGMNVTWHIRPTEMGSRVMIEHEFRRSLPLLGDQVFPWFVDRLFVRPIAGRTLATFKRLAEG